MKIIKYLSIIVLLVTFVSETFAQTPKIVWENVQEKYDRFEDIKPIIVNESAQPIYFDCSFANSDDFYVSNQLQLLRFNEENSRWIFNRMVCGFETKKMRKARIKDEKEIKRLKKKGKYIPAGCRLNPKEKFAVTFTKSQWTGIILGDFESYKAGRFKFTMVYDWSTAEDIAITESPEFWVAGK